MHHPALIAAAAVAVVWLYRRGRLGHSLRRALIAAAVAYAAWWCGPAVAFVVIPILLAVGWRRHRVRRSYRKQARFDRLVWRHIARDGAGTFTGNPGYEAFMHSAEWRRQKLAALELAGHRCAVPASQLGHLGGHAGRLEVHHNSNEVYSRLYQADVRRDLTVLCARHHSAVTQLHRYHGWTIRDATNHILGRQAAHAA
jgi:hypothetical protein